MKKVININFQGRVVPIEDSAYELLQQYITSLRTYFANEEGRDEIINDIESRIGELFEEQLKKGASCITDEHVTTVMDSMGRPADFEKADETEPANTNTGSTYTNASTGATSTGATYEYTAESTKSRRLYRDEQDKILGGVASGLANYFNVDPAIVRILFAVSVFFVGTGFLLYVILWIALPSKSLVNNIRKRLYRDTDDRIFKGVCGGLAKYFDINPIIPRIIFAAPFIFGLITTLGRNFFFQGPVFIGGFSGGSFILAYIILWAVLPEAVTASEKLEMKGEKVDLNSIRNTIVEDMQGFKGRAEKIKTDVKESTSRIMKNTQNAWESQGRPFVNEATGTIRRRSGGFGHAVGVLLKAFIMIIGGIIAFALVVALIALLSTGIGHMELTDFVLNGFWQKLLGWGVLLLFIGAPLLAIAISIIRRMMRTKSNSRYVSYTFSALWLIGLFCLITLIALLTKDFRYEQTSVNDVAITQPASGKLSLRLGGNTLGGDTEDWFDWNGALFIENDSLYLNNIKVNVIRSLDNNYHIHVVRMSNGGSRGMATQRIEKMAFPIVQNGDVVYFPENFSIGVADKWRNQRVFVVVEVPVGKIINVGRDLNSYSYFNVYDYHRRRSNRNIDSRWYNDQTWNSDEDMLQTRDELERADRTKEEEDENDERRKWEAPHNTPAPIAPPTIIDSTRRIDTAYRYPTSTTQLTISEKKKAKRNYNTLALSPLASILW